MIGRARNRVDLVVTAITLILSTVGFLLGAYALAVIGLIGGGVSLGLQLGSNGRGTQ